MKSEEKHIMSSF